LTGLRKELAKRVHEWVGERAGGVVEEGVVEKGA
jgi:hypothetical protein